MVWLSGSIARRLLAVITHEERANMREMFHLGFDSYKKSKCCVNNVFLCVKTVHLDHFLHLHAVFPSQK